MSKQNIDWSNLGFGYIKTDYRYVCRYKDGQWDEGRLETDANITLMNALASSSIARRALRA